MSSSHSSKSELNPVETASANNLSYLLIIAAAAAVGGFLFGFDTSVINGAVVAIQSDFAASDWLIGLAVSSALIGSAIGAFFAGPVSDHCGRPRTMLMAAFLFFISALGAGLAVGIADLVVWRVIGGLAIGAASVITPAYIAEVSPAHRRGQLGSFQQLAVVLGIFVTLLVDYAIATAAGSAENPFWFGITAWRWMFWTGLPPAVLYGVGALFLPESPRYLVARAREAEAATVLAQTVGGDVDRKVADIRRTVTQARQPRLTDLWGGTYGLLPVVWAGFGLAVFQQLVGINVIFYYSSVLWRAVGFTESRSLLITVVIAVTNIATTLLALTLVDRFGRKPLLLLGSGGMTLTLATLAIVFAGAPVVDGQPALTGLAGPIALVAANLYVFCFGFSWGPVMWIMLGEMFNNQIRTVAIAAAGTLQWLSNFLVSTTFPPLLAGVGPAAAYGLYTVAAAASLVFVLFGVQETQGLELEEM